MRASLVMHMAMGLMTLAACASAIMLPVDGNGIFQQRPMMQQLPNQLYEDVEVPLRSPLVESHWPRTRLHVGAISGVSINPDEDPVILHRHNVTWDQWSFNSSFIYQRVSSGPISVPVLLTLDRQTGAVKKAEGAGRFLLPHGLHVDAVGRRWVTDVALHQVFKLPPDSDTPLLTLGERLMPGDDSSHFCQPTAVATGADEVVFVADGYCNGRVAAFSTSGMHLADFGKNVGLELSVPHALAVQDDVLCVADRQHGRIVCWSLEDWLLQPRMIDLSDYGRLFSLSIVDDRILTVHQDREGTNALIIDRDTGDVRQNWGQLQTLSHPHDMTTSHDGRDLYICETSPARVHKYALVVSFEDTIGAPPIPATLPRWAV